MTFTKKELGLSLFSGVLLAVSVFFLRSYCKPTPASPLATGSSKASHQSVRAFSYIKTLFIFLDMKHQAEQGARFEKSFDLFQKTLPARLQKKEKEALDSLRNLSQKPPPSYLMLAQTFVKDLFQEPEAPRGLKKIFHHVGYAIGLRATQKVQKSFHHNLNHYQQDLLQGEGTNVLENLKNQPLTAQGETWVSNLKKRIQLVFLLQTLQKALLREST